MAATVVVRDAMSAELHPNQQTDVNERCADCSRPLVRRSPNSPAVRRCQNCWEARRRSEP